MVYSPLKAASKYFKYYIHGAGSKSGAVQNPFVNEFITKVMNDFTVYNDYTKIENLRKKLLTDTSKLVVQDFGAGSSRTKSNVRKVSSIAKNAAKPKKYGQLMYRMVKFYGCKNILELGTSLGLTTAYLASANHDARVITMEGADAIADKAANNFKEININNVEIVRGNFDNTLAEVLQKMPQVDFAFIDGNHREEPTRKYFEQLLPHTGAESVIVFDDIHWSRGMEAAWDAITMHPAVTAYIDLFYIGIVFFRKEFKEKQSFTVRF